MDVKKLVIVAGVIVGLVLFVQYFKKTDERALDEYAKERVQKMFNSLKSGTSGDRQNATGYWRIGRPEPTTQAEIDSFERFLGKKRLEMRIKSYEYVSSEVVDGQDQVNRRVRLKCRVDGRPLTLIVRQGYSLEWGD